ncbi:probable LIM domain-containing serine/threonine-protein kinase DDB_G0287001 [Chrysoperla carnea]|uniref:probable LIM domain-containing serine/threonine-protein kinase DDB_G0287001 n=1 Tax=Chrysoperla carnea TaxID=189513 RepID=UPI001D07489F|nr:probable LIM domain-containing serine/threonine-protein kinase DDB_G0287001 [Chrysoperla carnea]
MSTKNFLTIPKKLLFLSPQALGKSPTKIKYFSPQVNKVSRSTKTYAVRKLYFGTTFNNVNKVNNRNVSEFQHNRLALNLDSPTKKTICLQGITCPNQCIILGRGMFGITLKAIYNGQFVTAKNTASYTAPELFLGDKPTKKCDIYSLGIVFWEIHNQQMPYEGFLPDYVCKHKLRPITTNFESKHFIKLYKICWSEVPNIRPSIVELRKLLKNL